MAAPSAWHEHHEAAAGALEDVSVLPAHVVLESYSVLTRLPGGLAVPPATASDVLRERFPDEPLTLRTAGRRGLVATPAGAGVLGGASHDGLVALEAATHEQPLLTLDRRARETSQRLGVAYRPIA